MTTLAQAQHQAEPRRVGPVRSLRHGATLVWRNLAKIRHSPEQILDVTLQPIMFVLIFVYLLGGAISGGNRAEYLQYLIPGAMVQTVVFSTMSTAVGLNTDITNGIFDRFRSMPIARSAPLVGAIVGDTVRLVVSVAVLLGLATVLGFRIHTGPAETVAAVALVLLFALALCWVTALLGVLAKTPRTVQALGFLLVFPLTFGSNVFVPTVTLPGWLQPWVETNPVSLLSEAVRGLMLGGPVARPALWSVVWIVGITAVFAPLCVRAYRRRVS